MTRPDFSTGVDTTERLGPDDLATLREAQHLQAALAAQRLRAQRGEGDKPGTCSNCGAACLPLAVYCDDDCRQDHQHRTAVRSRQFGGMR